MTKKFMIGFLSLAVLTPAIVLMGPIEALRADTV